MDDIYAKVEVYPDHFEESKAPDDCLTSKRNEYSLRSRSHSWDVRRMIGSAPMFNLFRLARIPWASHSTDNDKVVLSKTEVGSLRSDIADAEEREAHLKAQLEHIDELLKVARLSGYLYIRTRWSELPGEPPILDDDDVDDWLPRFVVLHGQCIFYYLKSTDLSPQDTTLLADIIDAGLLPSFVAEDEERRYAFYVQTCHGLRFECSSVSKIQVDCWLATLSDCKLQPHLES
ncbi:hypothetical protein AXF42_Ash011072 [Apostasia shenzhenica]|uniref:PH domain-containing protein n=1 Tax=Apostasia shenzhenica TaxID=1088818 RepID=A0A2H9ZR17_9ASPA|nr:hypothetical protein AXF42_Ash011072 [Apostasia shenzhenica]